MTPRFTPDSIDAVLFDFGGVFTPSPFSAIESLSEETGTAPGQLLELVFGPYHTDSDHPWHRLERGEVSLREAREAIIALGNQQGIDSDPFRMFARMTGGEGSRDAVVDKTLALRAAGYRTALITNNAREFRERWMELVPVHDLFEVLIDSSEVGMRKPDPRIFQLALERLGGIPPQRSVFLDDAQSNIDAAARLGIHGILVADDPAHALATLDTLL